MKLIVCGMTAFFLLNAGGQVALMAQAKKSRTLVEGGGGSSTVRVKKPGGRVTSESYVKLAPVRAWTSRDGKVIHAELLSWPIRDPDAAKKPVEELRFSVLNDGKLRLRKGGKIFVLPLSRLADDDQRFVNEIRAYHTERLRGGGAGKKEKSERNETVSPEAASHPEEDQP